MKTFIATTVAVLAAISVLSASASASATIPCTTIAQREANRRTATALLTEVFNNHDASAVDRYIGPQYFQHNPNVPDGPNSLKAFTTLFTNETKVEFGASAVVGDFVWVNTRHLGLPRATAPSIGLDVFRFENGKIVEHWDILQSEVPTAQTASGHPMFPIQSALAATFVPRPASSAGSSGDDSSACPPIEPQLEANTKVAVALLDDVFNHRDVSAIDRYIGSPYIQHNPAVPDGPDALKEFTKLFTNETKVEFGATVAEGDLVWVNTRYTGLPGQSVSVAVDVFRFAVDTGKIVEHWDIIQVETPVAQTASGRPMFPIKG